MNLSQISINESNFNLDNLTNYLIFTCNENKTINLTKEISFILEGQTNDELSKDIYFKLSFNNTKDFYMSCVIFMNGSSLFCSFNNSNLKTDNYINIYSIKENEISTNYKNIFFTGLNKVEFIYEKGIEEEPTIKEKKNIMTIIIILIIIFVVIIIITIVFIIIKKKSKGLNSVNEVVRAKQTTSSNNQITVNGNSKEIFKLKDKNNHSFKS
jgi:hypothetical protein